MTASLFELLLLISLALAAVFWWHTNELRQIAHRIAKRQCAECEVQLLDDSVALSKVRLRRNSQGRIGLMCHFDFEFSSLGDVRYRGELQFLGKVLQHVEMEPHKL